MDGYRATHDQYGVGNVTYEQIEGTLPGHEHGRGRFVFEVGRVRVWRTATALSERSGLTRPMFTRSDS